MGPETAPSSPILPPANIERRKRKGTLRTACSLLIVVNVDDRFEPYNPMKRRAVSPSLSGPMTAASQTGASPVSVLGGKRTILNIQDTHDGLLKMTLQ